jgi:hypothetical protein
MPCYKASNYPGGVPAGTVSHATLEDCTEYCNEGACCEGTTCSIKPQCQCQGEGQVFKGVGTVCSPNPCSALICECDLDDNSIANASAVTLSAISASFSSGPTNPFQPFYSDLSDGGACVDDAGMIAFLESISLSLSRVLSSSSFVQYQGSGYFTSPFSTVFITVSVLFQCSGSVSVSLTMCPTNPLSVCLGVSDGNSGLSTGVSACASSASVTIPFGQQGANQTRPDGCRVANVSASRIYTVSFSLSPNPLP